MDAQIQMLRDPGIDPYQDHHVDICPGCGFPAPKVWGCVTICGNCGHRTSCHD